MVRLVWFALALTCVTIACGQVTNTAVSEEKLEQLLVNYNANLIAYCNRVQQTSWDVATDVGNKQKEKANVSVHIQFSRVKVKCQQRSKLKNEAVSQSKKCLKH